MNLVDPLAAYATEHSIDLSLSVPVARAVVDQFISAGYYRLDVSLGVENDIYVCSGPLTAMIDPDGDVALAVPGPTGRKYIDVQPDEVASTLITWLQAALS